MQFICFALAQEYTHALRTATTSQATSQFVPPGLWPSGFELPATCRGHKPVLADAGKLPEAPAPILLSRVLYWSIMQATFSGTL